MSLHPHSATNPEADRLRAVTDDSHGWRRWGPYLSDRAWGTVREDYSADGDAWRYLPYALSRSKAYRWGEDGIAGICDRFQLLCFAPTFWNEVDTHLKVRRVAAKVRPRLEFILDVKNSKSNPWARERASGNPQCQEFNVCRSDHQRPQMAWRARSPEQCGISD
jgi:hypothetical protein